MGRLKRLHPAEQLLELKVCDPAMGSGHFLVNLVDYLADRVIEAMAESEALVDGYLSPLVERIDGIRNTIMDNAEDRGWTFDPAQLDDRHIVRRMVLKRRVYGVDKNPMAVELAKVSLWLHTFTVGAPLEEKEGAWPVGGNRYQSPSGEWVPLYVGRMIHQFDHRAASVHLNERNLHNPALSDDIGADLKADPAFVPAPQYWVPRKKISLTR